MNKRKKQKNASPAVNNLKPNKIIMSLFLFIFKVNMPGSNKTILAQIGTDVTSIHGIKDEWQVVLAQETRLRLHKVDR